MKDKLDPCLQPLLKAKSPAVIGLGNRDRGDDGCGLEIAEMLKARFPRRAFSEAQKSAEALTLELIENDFIETVLYIDAADFGGRPGEFRLFDSDRAASFSPSFSTHKVPITLLMELLRQHGKQSFLLGIQPENLGLFSPVSEAVLRTVQMVYDHLSFIFAQIHDECMD